MKILVVDSSKKVKQKLIQYLELETQFENVFEAESVKEAKTIMQTFDIDVVLFDIQLQDASGLALVSFCQLMPNKPIMILCSNYRYPQYISIYSNMSVDYSFDKFSELTELKTVIRNNIQNWQNKLLMNNKKNSNKIIGGGNETL
jgi:DNA-binding NtrC family response regulator